MKAYEAPWSTSLLIISSAATLVCVSIVAAIAWNAHRFTWEAMLPLAIVFGGALFTVRGYAISPDAILVHRLFWTTHVPLAGLQSAEFESEARCGGFRICGNGGLFSFTGFFWNKNLGTYRAFVTDFNRAVVLRFPERTIVVSPAEPEDFVREVNATTHG